MGIQNYPSSVPSVIPPLGERALWDLGSWGSRTMHDELFIRSGDEKVLPSKLPCSTWKNITCAQGPVPDDNGKQKAAAVEG